MSTAKPFTLLIKPVSGDCNLGCGYCFYLKVPERVYPDTRIHRMDGATLESLVRKYLGLRFPNSSFAWQGGEPTLAGLEFFKEAVRLERKHGADGQSVANGFQTNGLLIDGDWARFFQKYKFLIGLSLDGPKDIHDAYRSRRVGTGTHSEVLRALKTLQRWEIGFNVLSVVTKANVRRGGELYRYYRDLGVTHVQFIPAVETDPKTGQPAEFTVSPEEYGDFLCEVFDQWIAGDPRRFSVRDFESILAHYVDSPDSMCIHGPLCDTYFLIEYTGDVYPCDFFCDPKWKLGNSNENGFEELRSCDLYRRFAEMKSDLPEECQACPWLKPCWGGCTKDRLNIFGQANVKGYFCESYKRFLPHAEPGMLALKQVIELIRQERRPKDVGNVGRQMTSLGQRSRKKHRP
jgi:uncharacterized protein